jgi:oxygen-independent coproporphyrinogen III oxidase
MYIHFPFCRHLCNYCDFHKKVLDSYSDVDNFQKYLEKSFLQHNNFLQDNNASCSVIDTLYIGGGTPSLWGARGINFLRNLLAKNSISFADNYEFTLELNPGGWNKRDLVEIKKLGVNRVSVGVQSLSKATLTALDRIHSVDDVYRTLDSLAELGFNFSVDFMLGLPKEKVGDRDIVKEVNEILSFNPSHLSSYILTVNKNYVHYNLLPDDNFIADEYLTLAKLMNENGFEHYEVSNFAKNGARSKHNLKYWRGESVTALGPSATGFLQTSKDRGVRYKWKTSGHTGFSIEEINSHDYMLERFFLNLRISDGVNLYNFLDTSNKMSEISNFVDELERQGHLICADLQKLSLSSSGFLCADSITTRFLSYM